MSKKKTLSQEPERKGTLPKAKSEGRSSEKGRVTWQEVIQEAGELPKGQLRRPFEERAAEAEGWAKKLKQAPSGRPIVRMGRPSKVAPKVETGLVTFRTDKGEKEALEALAEAQGRTLSDLLRDVTHELVATFRAGQKRARARA